MTTKRMNSFGRLRELCAAIADRPRYSAAFAITATPQGSSTMIAATFGDEKIVWATPNTTDDFDPVDLLTREAEKRLRERAARDRAVLQAT